MQKIIYKVIPVPVITTDRFIPQRFSAMSLGILVLIRPIDKYNTALIEHELTHCKQFYRTFGVHAVLYWLSKKYRLKVEVEAYQRQAEVSDDPQLDKYAYWIATKYNLSVTQDEALELINTG